MDGLLSILSVLELLLVIVVMKDVIVVVFKDTFDGWVFGALLHTMQGLILGVIVYA